MRTASAGGADGAGANPESHEKNWGPSALDEQPASATNDTAARSVPPSLRFTIGATLGGGHPAGRATATTRRRPPERAGGQPASSSSRRS